MKSFLPLLLLFTTTCLSGQYPVTENVEIRIGSKKFTESVILGEVATLLAQSAGASVVHRRELGGTRLLWNALLNGDIDAYPEYTGTIAEEILNGVDGARNEGILSALDTQGVRMSRPFGFNNTYAIGVTKVTAQRLSLSKISDLRSHPNLVFGFSNEFMDRADGWPSLRTRYTLPQQSVRGLDHDLAYRGLESGTIHVTDLYSTDAEIRFYSLRVLEDDLGHFVNYYGVLLYRQDLKKRVPEVLQALLRMEGSISEALMVEMNSEVKLGRISEHRVAADFLKKSLEIETTNREEDKIFRFVRHSKEHLFLVLVSLACAMLVSVPLGILAAKRPKLGQAVLGVVGIIQTIPSLALLVFMIPLLGIGAPPAIVALFLYSLLPIVRNTYTGLKDIPTPTLESAQALGLPPRASLRLVELPIASRSILAGIKTSAVINVGTATLGALIGAGGYGQPILTGIRLDNMGLILEGAIPAATLALVVQTLFDLAERVVVPKGLRLKVDPT